MTGEELYELSAKGYKHEPFSKLNKELQEYYNECARTRCRNNNDLQR